MSILRPQSRPALVMAAAGVAMAGALGIAGTASAADWPMFRANPGHSGVSPETAISTTTAHSLTTRWTARLGTPSYTSPAVATSRGRTLVYAGAGNHFYAYPAGGGAAAWRFTVPAGVVENSPAVAGGVVYFASTAGTIYALNASTGAQMCSFSTGHAILASPVVVSTGSGPVVYDGTVPTGASGAEYAIYGPGNTHGACMKDWQFSSWAGTPDGTWSSAAYGMGAGRGPLLVFGQTAMFFYLAHRLVLEVPATYFGLRDTGTLTTTYVVAAAMLVWLYPACRWYRSLRAAHPNSFLRYL